LALDFFAADFLAAPFFAADFLAVTFFAALAGGTFAPLRRASDKPIAMACFGFVTLRPLRPERSFPCFMAFISRSTERDAPEPYFLCELAEDLRAVFFAGGIKLPPQVGSSECCEGCLVRERLCSLFENE
jgi:hypothetical protein